MLPFYHHSRSNLLPPLRSCWSHSWHTIVFPLAQYQHIFATMTSHSSTARSVQKRYAMDTDYLVDFAKRRPSPKATSAVSNRRRRRSEILELLFKDAEAVKGEATSRGETQSSLALSRVVLRSTTRARSCRRSWQKTTRRGHPHSRSLSSIDVDMSDSEEEEEGRTASQTRSVLLKTCFQSEIEAARRPSRRERRKGKGETPDSSKVTTPILQKRSQNPLQSEKSSRKSRSQSLKTEKLVTGMSKKPLQKERSTRKSRSRSLKTEKSGVVEGKSSRKSRKGIVMKSQSLPLLGLYMSDSEEEEDQSAPPSRTDNQKEQHDRKESKGGIPSSSGGRSRRTSASRRPRSGKNDSSNTSMTPATVLKASMSLSKRNLSKVYCGRLGRSVGWLSSRRRKVGAGCRRRSRNAACYPA